MPAKWNESCTFIVSQIKLISNERLCIRNRLETEVKNNSAMAYRGGLKVWLFQEICKLDGNNFSTQIFIIVYYL